MDLGNRGMSVIEIVVSFSFLAISALGLIAAMTRLMLAQSTSSHHTVAKMLAESRLQKASLSGPPDFGIPTGTVGSAEVRVGQNRELVNFFYSLESEQMLEPPGDPLGKEPSLNLPDMGTVWELRVKVWWNEEDQPTGAVERGTQTLKVSRLTYVEL